MNQKSNRLSCPNLAFYGRDILLDEFHFKLQVRIARGHLLKVSLFFLQGAQGCH